MNSWKNKIIKQKARKGRIRDLKQERGKGRTENKRLVDLNPIILIMTLNINELRSIWGRGY